MAAKTPSTAAQGRTGSSQQTASTSSTPGMATGTWSTATARAITGSSDRIACGTVLTAGPNPLVHPHAPGPLLRSTTGLLVTAGLRRLAGAAAGARGVRRGAGVILASSARGRSSRRLFVRLFPALSVLGVHRSRQVLAG